MNAKCSKGFNKFSCLERMEIKMSYHNGISKARHLELRRMRLGLKDKWIGVTLIF